MLYCLGGAKGHGKLFNNLLVVDHVKFYLIIFEDIFDDIVDFVSKLFSFTSLRSSR